MVFVRTFGFPKPNKEQLSSVAASPQQAAGQPPPERGKWQLLCGGKAANYISALEFSVTCTQGQCYHELKFLYKELIRSPSS